MLKSHGCHVLMQHLLPIPVRASLPEKMMLMVIDIYRFLETYAVKITAKRVTNVSRGTSYLSFAEPR